MIRSKRCCRFEWLRVVVAVAVGRSVARSCVFLPGIVAALWEGVAFETAFVLTGEGQLARAQVEAADVVALAVVVVLFRTTAMLCCF